MSLADGTKLSSARRAPCITARSACRSAFSRTTRHQRFWGKLMAPDTQFAAVRPLLLAAAWFVLLAGAAFAWASVVEGSASQPPAHATVLSK